MLDLIAVLAALAGVGAAVAAVRTRHVEPREHVRRATLGARSIARVVARRRSERRAGLRESNAVDDAALVVAVVVAVVVASVARGPSNEADPGLTLVL